MKKFKVYFAAVIFAVAVLSSSCDEDILPSMSASIGGSEWKTSLVAGVVYSDYLTIVGTNVNGSAIFVSVKATGTGTYTLEPIEGEAQTFGVYYLNGQDDTDDSKKYLSSSGTVTITEFTDKRISGTFSFSGLNSLEDTIEITSGKFDNVLYTEM